MMHQKELMVGCLRLLHHDSRYMESCSTVNVWLRLRRGNQKKKTTLGWLHLILFKRGYAAVEGVLNFGYREMEA